MTSEPPRLTVVGLIGVPEVGASQIGASQIGASQIGAGDQLAHLVMTALAASGEVLRDGDVLVVSSKIVSKSEGAVHPAADRSAVIAAQTVRVVAERQGPRGTTRVVRSRSGPVLAAAGVDASNTAAGTVLSLPVDPDLSARELWRAISAATGRAVAVVVTDTAGRPWREGQTDIAIGAAGLRVLDDLRGGVDAGGQPLEVTVRGIADEVAAAADLVKGKAAGIPVALIRGLAEFVLTSAGDRTREPAGDTGDTGNTGDDGEGTGAGSLVRAGAGDWFRHGHVEAVRAAMAAGPHDPASPGPAPLLPGSVGDRLRTAVDLAVAAPDPLTGRPLDVDIEVDVPPAHDVRLLVAAVTGPARGALAQRLRAGLWSADLTADLTLDGDALVLARVTDLG